MCVRRELLAAHGHTAVYSVRVLCWRAVHKHIHAAPLAVHEAQIHRRLNHPNIVPLWGTWTRRDSVILVMPQAETSLVDAILRGVVFDRRGVLADAARGLEHMHSMQICHFDVKPDNIVLARCGRAMLIDFGMACEEASFQSARGQPRCLGTISYMAPEMLRDADSRVKGSKADVWSLGVTTVAVAIEKLPFEIADASAPDFTEYADLLLCTAGGMRCTAALRRLRYGDAFEHLPEWAMAVVDASLHCTVALRADMRLLRLILDGSHEEADVLPLGIDPALEEVGEHQGNPLAERDGEVGRLQASHECIDLA